MNPLDELSKLSDAELIQRAETLAASERVTTVDLLWSLAGLERRRLVQALGYADLFAYCNQHFRMPESTSSRYARTASLMARFPIAGEHLKEGRLSPTTLLMLEKLLTEENHRQIFDEAAWMTMKQVTLLIAKLAPAPDVKESLTFVPERAPKNEALSLFSQPTPTAEPKPMPTPSESPRLDCVATVVTIPPTTTLAELGAQLTGTPQSWLQPTAELKPIRPGRYRLKANIPQETVDALDRIKSALSHTMPGANLGELLIECIRLADEELARKKHAALTRKSPRASKLEVSSTSAAPVRASSSEANSDSATGMLTSNLEISSASATRVAPSNLEVSSTSATPPAPSNLEVSSAMGTAESEGYALQFLPKWLRGRREPSNEVKRQVRERDRGCCSFVGMNGHRCESTWQLEYDHWLAYARGGEPTFENVRLLCKRHNLFCAIETFGAEFMARFLGEARTGERRSP